MSGQIVKFPLDEHAALVAGILLLVRKRRQAQPGPAEPSRHLAAGH